MTRLARQPHSRSARHEALFNETLNLGVDGFLLKDGAVTEIVAAIGAVAAGRAFISQDLSAT